MWWAYRTEATQRRGTSRLAQPEYVEGRIGIFEGALRDGDLRTCARVLHDSRLDPTRLGHALSDKSRALLLPELYGLRAAHFMQYGDPKRGVREADYAIRGFHKRGELLRVAQFLGVKSAALRNCWRMDEARRAVIEARQLVFSHDNWPTTPHGVAVLASTPNMALNQNDLASAEREVYEGLRVAEETGTEVRRLEALFRMSELELKRGKIEEAERILEEDLRPKLFPRGNNWLRGWFWRWKLDVLTAQGATVEVQKAVWRAAWDENKRGGWRFQLEILNKRAEAIAHIASAGA